MPTGSQFLAHSIHDYGVTHVFFVPMILASTLAELDRLGVARVSTHSELSAVYMADGYARAARRPGICLTQAVGATNAAAGLRDAFLAGSPVICITGGPHPDSRYRHLYQQVDDFSMFEPVTKLNAMVEKVERLPDLLRQAFRTATTGAPGPVHLEIAGRVGQVLEKEADLKLVAEQRFGQYPPHRPAADGESVDKAARLLSATERVVIVAGGGVTASDAAPELVKLAEKLSIPVIVSLNGKEAIPDHHPLAVGLSGTYGRWCANELLAQAELVFWVGSQAGGHVTDLWQAPPAGTASIQLDINPGEIGLNYSVEVDLVGDARVILRQLSERVESDRDRSAWVRLAQGLVGAWRSQVSEHASSEAVPLRPERICKEISEVLPPDVVLVADTGHAAQWSGTMISLDQPGQRYIRCAGTLGWGLPGAIGAKCALPNRPVICFTGDGGFYYHLSELETASRLGINVVVVVNNNCGLSQTARGFNAAYGGRSSGPGRDMWCFNEMNFARIAEDMGCLGIRVEKAGDIQSALNTALAANRPTVVDIVSDPLALPPQPWRKSP